MNTTINENIQQKEELLNLNAPGVENFSIDAHLKKLAQLDGLLWEVAIYTEEFIKYAPTDIEVMRESVSDLSVMFRDIMVHILKNK